LRSGLPKHERGGALLLTLLALSVLGMLVTAAWLMGLAELRVARTPAAVTRALAAAEEGVQVQIVNWRLAGYNRLGVGGAAGFAGLAPDLGSYGGSVRRLSELLFLIESEGLGPGRAAHQRVGLLVRLSALELSIRAALQSHGAVRLAGVASVSGFDEAPAGWPCPAPGVPRPGIRLSEGAPLELVDCPGLACVKGDPPVLSDTTPTRPSRIAGVEVATLRDLADKVVGPGRWTPGPSQVAGKCRHGVPFNWGDPDRPGGACGDYLPLIFAAGDVRLHGGRGQGILVVDGDLVVSGGFRFYGPILVLGQFDTTGEGGHFKGGVVAATVVVAQSGLAGPSVGYSSCAVRRAVVAQGGPEPIVDRSWMRLYRIP
jgi:hypothetical protein